MSAPEKFQIYETNGTGALVYNNSIAALPGRVLATFPTGLNPSGIAITRYIYNYDIKYLCMSDSRYAYVCNNNNYAISGQYSVTVLDLVNLIPITTIFDASFNQPYTATLRSDGTICYITNSGSTTVTIISTATNTVTGTIAGFTQPSGI